MESFELVDGTRFFYDKDEAFVAFYVFAWRLGCGEEAEMPRTFRMLEKAADPLAALDGMRPPRPDLTPCDFEYVFDVEHLAQHRELVIREEALEPAVDLSE